MNWNEGYATDVEYTTGFFPELSPSYLNFACVLNGVEPVPIQQSFSYCELGCGQGFTVNLLAAAYPQGDFYAVDFMPAQIARATQLQAAAELQNLTMLEGSFAELAAGEHAGLPQFDFITMYGVYTWVNQENRQHIVNFISRYLKPGGVVFTTYNALPGWSAAMPMQKLLMAYADTRPDRSDIQVMKGRDFIEQLSDMDAQYFTANASNDLFEHRFDSLIRDNLNYLVHEYLHQDWQPMYHADVAKDLQSTKLDYAGSADLFMAFPHLYLSEDKLNLLKNISNPVFAETVKDYCLNIGFRKDVFIRGARRMNKVRQIAWLERVGLALLVPRFQAHTNVEFMKGKEDQYAALLDVLEESPRLLKDLIKLPVFSHLSLLKMAEMAAVLISGKQVANYFEGSASSTATKKMNDALAKHAVLEDSYQAFSSPVLGNGISAGLMQRLVYLALYEGATESGVQTITDRVWQRIKAQESLPEKTDELSQSDEGRMAEVAETVKGILKYRLPIWRQLKII